MLNPFPNRKNIFSPKRLAKPSCPILSMFASHSVIVGSTQPYIILPNFCWYGPLVALSVSLCSLFIDGIELTGTLMLSTAIDFSPSVFDLSSPAVPTRHPSCSFGRRRFWCSHRYARLPVGWMLIYLIPLPIWNAFLLAYTSWHPNSSSRGQTITLKVPKMAILATTVANSTLT